MDLTEAVLRMTLAEPDYRAVFERNPVGMAVLNGAGTVLTVNRALAQFLGKAPADLLGTALHDLATVDDVGRFRSGVSERRLRHDRGQDLWVVVSAVELPESGDRGLLVCIDDATGQRNTERVLLHAALHDSLTNLPNRRLLTDRLDTALARSQRSNTTVAVLFIDLDRFKDVNDTFGHDAGDEVLISVASGIHAAMRSCDTVARWGGDEFVVVCEDLGADDAVERLAERLLAGIERPVRIDGRNVTITASIGVAVAGPHVESGDQLIRIADLAMYRAKHRPGTAYVVADGEDATHASDPSPHDGGLLADLRHAIQADLLQLHYQPVVRSDGELIGLEALVRWPHPRLGMLMPSDFLPRVAGTDLARPLSDWVLRAAMRDAASWHDPRLRVSVNVWAAEVARPGFADTVAMLLTWAGLQSRGLYLEMHEFDLAEAGPGLADELDKLRRLGVGLAIDDFGTGGTSLAGLRRLPVDTLKVDRSFVAGCLTDPDDNAVVAAVATAARAAGRHALASGVETVEQLRMLTGLGYESFQGYLSGAPAPLIDLRDAIAHRRVAMGPS
ncbi:MAG: EAL domain-containing protein [Spirochaetaceae bacterium]|nr:EAL domain-containing protein [Spirochaetaceae bacterium]